MANYWKGVKDNCLRYTEVATAESGFQFSGGRKQEEGKDLETWRRAMQEGESGLCGGPGPWQLCAEQRHLLVNRGRLSWRQHANPLVSGGRHSTRRKGTFFLPGLAVSLQHPQLAKLILE